MSNEKSLTDILADVDEDATFIWKAETSATDIVLPEKSVVGSVSAKAKPESKKNQFSISEPVEPPSEPKKTNNFDDTLVIQRIIGEGGVGCVRLAYDKTIGRRVAVKELLEAVKGDSLLQKTFIHEAKITGKLEHPGIIPVYQLGYREDGTAYYVMRYVKGETLEEQIKKCRKSTVDLSYIERIKLLDTLIDTCDTLAYAHSKGVIHRDLKPSNIISGKFGETIVLDWGVAQAIDEGDGDFFSTVRSDQIDTYSDNDNTYSVGTLSYMAPEQLNGKAVKASDVYSLGVILFRLISGELPYKGSSPDIETQLLSVKPSPSPSRYVGIISPELGAICEKAMAKNPDDRFADASELSHQLKAYRDGRMVNIYSYSRQELFQRFLARNKFAVIMFALLFSTVIVGAIFSIHYAVRMDHAREKAEDALVSVTALGEQAQEQANIIATNITVGTDELFTTLKKTANQLVNLAPSAQNELLKTLYEQYPSFTSITIEKINPSALSWKVEINQFDAPVAVNMVRENDELTLIFSVPIQKQNQNQVMTYLVVKVLPEKVLPKFFHLQVSNHVRDIWMMKDDGLIFYDVEKQYRGSNIFTDTLNNQSPSVVAFGHLIANKSSGIGYYSFPDNGKKRSKIAAWQTVNVGTQSWKIVVDYTYLVN